MPGGDPMRVVVADDVMLTREGITRLLTDAGVNVVGEAGDAASLLRAVRMTQADLPQARPQHRPRLPPARTGRPRVRAYRHLSLKPKQTRASLIKPGNLAGALQRCARRCSGVPVERCSHGSAGFLGFGWPAQNVRYAYGDDGTGHRSDQVHPPGGQAPRARSGPKLLAGFIEAPSKGPPMVPQAMM